MAESVRLDPGTIREHATFEPLLILLRDGEAHFYLSVFDCRQQLGGSFNSARHIAHTPATYVTSEGLDELRVNIFRNLPIPEENASRAAAKNAFLRSANHEFLARLKKCRG